MKRVELVPIGKINHIVKEVGRASLFIIGKSNNNQNITKYIPKSQMYKKDSIVYVPKWLAESFGIWTKQNPTSYDLQKLYPNEVQNTESVRTEEDDTFHVIDESEEDLPF